MGEPCKTIDVSFGSSIAGYPASLPMYDREPEPVC